MPQPTALKKDSRLPVLFLAALLCHLAGMEDVIYMRDVLKTMRQKDANGRAVKFDITVRTLNKFSKTGGEFREYKGAKEVMQEDGIDYNSFEMLLKKPKAKKARKDPKHHDNKTRNIRLASGEIKKIHIRHIDSFNGKKMLY